MAQKGVQLHPENFSCPICLDRLKDPVVLPCRHSYCMDCIKAHWDAEGMRGTYSCPQCRKTFIPRPDVVKNTVLAGLVEELKKTGLQAAPADHCYAGPADVACDFCSGRKLKAVRTCLDCRASSCQDHLKLHDDVVPFRKHKLVEPSKNLQENICSRHEKLKEIFCRTDQQIICYFCTMDEHQGHHTVSAAAERAERQKKLNLQQKLEQEIAELKSKDGELERLSHTEDPIQFLHSCPSLSALRESPHSSIIYVGPLSYFEDVTAAVSEVRDKLQHILTERRTNISELLLTPEPKTREEFLQYYQEITLDPNTAHRWLELSEGNREVTFMEQSQSYLEHPDRFTGWCPQVLSRESLSERCYWEVEWRWGGEGSVAAAYKDMKRAGGGNECGFGSNDKSWSLYCDQNSFRFLHNNISTNISGPGSSRKEVKDLRKELKKLKEKCEDMEGRMRRSNIRILGVAETTGSSSSAAESKLLVDVLHLEKGPLDDRPHRGFGPRSRSGKSRIIIARLHYHQDDLEILRRVRSIGQLRLNGEPVAIFPDYTASVAKARAAFTEVRKLLWDREGSRYGLLFPARLHITHGGENRRQKGHGLYEG
ncbi:E3 ubiquitin/ISG15 ligase TRIM25-like [Pholidichthys leucotaenia]